MKISVTIGTGGLEEKDLVVLKSALNLRGEDWIWVEAPQRADVWIADATRPGSAQALAGADPARVILVTEDASRVPSGAAAHVLGKPVKAMQLMRALDRLLAARTPIEPPAAASSLKPSPASAVVPAAPSEGAAQAHPWRGRRIRLVRPANLAKYPVTAELLGWVQRLSHDPVAYDALVAALPLDMELLHAILNDAAHHGHLVDEGGAPLPAFGERKEGLVGRLLGRHRN